MSTPPNFEFQRCSLPNLLNLPTIFDSVWSARRKPIQSFLLIQRKRVVCNPRCAFRIAAGHFWIDKSYKYGGRNQITIRLTRGPSGASFTCLISIRSHYGLIVFRPVWTFNLNWTYPISFIGRRKAIRPTSYLSRFDEYEWKYDLSPLLALVTFEYVKSRPKLSLSPQVSMAG